LSAPTPANNNVSYLVVAGGASGATGCVSGGGGGAGGYREGKVSTDPYTASPLDSTAGLPVSVQSISYNCRWWWWSYNYWL
jgi:hypothetical protein